MNCEDVRPLLSGHLDGELTPEERLQMENHLSHCTACREELTRLRELKEVTDMVSAVELPDRFWDTYWTGIYNRLERGLGWFLLLAGGALLAGYGFWELARVLLHDSELPWVARLGIGLAAGGLGVLLYSVVRERWFLRKHDPYREVRR
jgi:hypothetical protein